MKTIVMNSTNVVAGSNNTVFEYIFPGGGVKLTEKDHVALASITMYNSSPNISTVYVNDSFQYRWVDNSLFTVTLETGFYEILDINNAMHQTMLNNGHYLVENATGNYVWFLTMAVNAATYKIDVVTYRLTAALFPIGVGPTQYTFGTGSAPAWTNPSTNAYPQLVVLSNGFRQVIGFDAGSYPSSLFIPTVTNITTSSTSVPQVNPLSAYTVKCNLVNNVYSVPNNVLYSFSPTGAFGSQFTIAPNEYVYIDVSPGYYNVFRVELTDQNNRGVVILDPNIIILILIKAD